MDTIQPKQQMPMTPGIISTQGSEQDFFYLPLESLDFPPICKAPVTSLHCFHTSRGLICGLFFENSATECMGACVGNEFCISAKTLYSQKIDHSIIKPKWFLEHLIIFSLISTSEDYRFIMQLFFENLLFSWHWLYNREQDTVPPSRILDRGVK